MAIGTGPEQRMTVAGEEGGRHRRFEEVERL
jgi:hypothetical protein